MTEIIFEARALGYSIFTHDEDWNELKEMAKEAVLCHFDETETPRMIRLHQVRDGVIAL